MTNSAILDLARRTFLRDVPLDACAVRGFGHPDTRIIRPGVSHEGFIGDAVCTIGAFDGVHRGHRYLFQATIQDARRRGVPSVILTFDPDPDELFFPTARIHKLLNNEDRLSFLTKFGADFVVCLPFNRELAAHSTEAFFKTYVFPTFMPKASHVGADFKLGAGNAGNVAELRQLGSVRGRSWEVNGYDLLCNRAAPVSATRIRHLLIDEGDCRTANNLLQRAHFVRGTVVRGRQKGRTFGFPTANVSLSYPYVVPAEGVYAGLVLVDGVAWPAAINVGIPRTFADEPNCASIEANMVGFNEDIYGREVAVAFIEKLRGQQKFASLDELMAAVNGNIDWVRTNIGPTGFRI